MPPDFQIGAYGYRTDLNDPEIRDLYFRFKAWKGIPEWCPLEDRERYEFDSWVMRYYARKRAQKKTADIWPASRQRSEQQHP